MTSPVRLSPLTNILETKAMNVLVLNCGSSTLKSQLIDSDREICLARGVVDGIGKHAMVELLADGKTMSERRSVNDHEEAARIVLAWTGGRIGVDVVGHRVVHGGSRFVQPTLVSEDVIDAIDGMDHLAPLHNRPAIAAMRATLEALPSTPSVAVFDTAFHSEMPKKAASYPIPQELAARHEVRRYGFHGLAHRYMAEQYATLTSSDLSESRLITLQLGNGCSAAAVRDGVSVDTSMGLTPLEGLMMGTRSGDVDPALPGHLARQEGVSIDEVEAWLNKESGLLGVSGNSSDMRHLLEQERQGDAQASLAIDMFCYRITKYIGAYMAALGGADAVVFGGGIGENSPKVRERICRGMDWCGLALDPARNTAGAEGCISSEGASVHAYVVKVNEELIIARDTAKLLGQEKGAS